MSFFSRFALVVVAVVCCALFAETERADAMTLAVLSAAVVAIVAAAVVPADDAAAKDADVLASRFDAPPTAAQLSR